MTEPPIEVMPANVGNFRDWLANRGGIAVWNSQDLSNPGRSWSTPALTEDGKPYSPPHWSTGKTPDRIVTDSSDVVVIIAREVQRFRVGLKRGCGLTVVLTDASTRKVLKAVKKHGDTAWYDFDYDTQEAVIFVEDRRLPLQEYDQ